MLKSAQVWRGLYLDYCQGPTRHGQKTQQFDPRTLCCLLLYDLCFRQFLVPCIWWFIPCTESFTKRHWHLHGKLPSEWQDQQKHQQKTNKTIRTPQHPTKTDQNKQKYIKTTRNQQNPIKNPSNNIKQPINIHQPCHHWIFLSLRPNRVESWERWCLPSVPKPRSWVM